MCGNLCGDRPDTSGQVAMAQASAQVGNRMADITERQNTFNNSLIVNDLLPLARENAASDQALKRVQTALANDQQERRRNVFDPLEDQVIGEAKNWDSADRINQEVGRAGAAVLQAYDKQLGSIRRDSLRFGVNPNSAKSMALRENAAVDVAAAQADAGSAAADRVKAGGFARRFDAAGLGRNLASNQTAAADSAVRAGSSAVNSIAAPINATNQTTGATAQGFGVASSAYRGAADSYGGAARTEAEFDPAAGFGRLVGFGVGKWMGA